KYLSFDDTQVRARAAEVLKSIGTSASLDALATASKQEVFADPKRAIDGAIAAIQAREKNAVAAGAKRPSESGPTSRPPVTSVGANLFANGPRVFLSELPEFDVKNGMWPYSKNGNLGNGSDKVRVDKKESPHGLGMHPPRMGSYAAAKFRIGKQAALFRST